jgi:carbamoyl-phosphate synthase large subunit
VAKSLSDVERVVAQLGGFPVLVRPSYVLSGAAMRVAHGAAELRGYLARATEVSPAHPVVISRFEHHARELELDAVADQGELVLWAVSEHVEDAGVHSGDATLVLPPQRLYAQTVREVREIGARLARALAVTGPFNVQLLARRNRLKVIECNLRASRSAPFVSKVLGTNFITEATRLMLGAPRTPGRTPNQAELEYVAVTAPQFSFRRLTGADPLLGIEMASTGEVACFGADGDEALLKAMLATGFRVPTRGVLLSLGPVGDKYRFADEARLLRSLGLALYATVGTGEILRAEGIECTYLDKDGPGGEHPDAVEALRAGLIDLVINVPRAYDASGRPDGFRIRRAAIDLEIPLVTDLWLARRLASALVAYRVADLPALPWHAYVPRS